MLTQHKSTILALLFLFSELGVLLYVGAGDLVLDQQLAHILLLTEELVKMVDEKHIEIDLLILESRQCLHMLIGEVVLFKLDQRLIDRMIALKLRKRILPRIREQLINQPHIHIRPYPLRLLLPIQVINLDLLLLHENALTVLPDIGVDLLLLLPEQLGDDAVVEAILGDLDPQLLFEVDDVVVEGHVQPVRVLLGEDDVHVQGEVLQDELLDVP